MINQGAILSEKGFDFKVHFVAGEKVYGVAYPSEFRQQENTGFHKPICFPVKEWDDAVKRGASVENFEAGNGLEVGK